MSLFIKKLGKYALGKAYVGARLKLSPSVQAAKKEQSRIKDYTHQALGVGLAGTALVATGPLGDFAYKASQIHGASEVPITIYQIITEAYKSDGFYRSSWQFKGKFLAKKILKSPKIKRNIAEAILAEIVFRIMKKYKNRQGSIKLAEEIATQALLEPMIEEP